MSVKAGLARAPYRATHTLAFDVEQTLLGGHASFLTPRAQRQHLLWPRLFGSART